MWPKVQQRKTQPLEKTPFCGLGKTIHGRRFHFKTGDTAPPSGGPQTHHSEVGGRTHSAAAAALLQGQPQSRWLFLICFWRSWRPINISSGGLTFGRHSFQDKCGGWNTPRWLWKWLQVQSTMQESCQRNTKHRQLPRHENRQGCTGKEGINILKCCRRLGPEGASLNPQPDTGETVICAQWRNRGSERPTDRKSHSWQVAELGFQSDSPWPLEANFKAESHLRSVEVTIWSGLGKISTPIWDTILKARVLNWVQPCSPGDTQRCLQTFLGVTMWNVLLASSG